MQQVSMALGIAAAAIALTAAHGTAPTALTQADFTIAFAVTAAIALIGALLMLRLPRDAGHAVTGHQPRRARTRSTAGIGQRPPPARSRRERAR
jgi:hypothetical protein